jgi:hypothetical protein
LTNSDFAKNFGLLDEIIEVVLTISRKKTKLRLQIPARVTSDLIHPANCCDSVVM